MTTLNFKTSINAPAKKVWQVLWNDSTYRKWTSVFHEGSYAVSDWKEGSKIQFITSEGDGMFSLIEQCKPNELMAFKHLGELKKFEEQPAKEKTNSWNGAMETYSLKEENGITALDVKLDSTEEHKEYFAKTFPEAMALIKKLAEHPVELTTEITVAAPVEKVWKFWTEPGHITKWNTASEDWHTPHAENDLRKGGKFLSRMEAKDGSFGFDFAGVYDEVIPNELIRYTMGDGRKAKITFTPEGKNCKITVVFEAEEMNPLEMQQGGWQAISNSFKKYAETN